MILADITNLAQLNARSGIGLRDVVLGILGTLAILVLAGRAIAAFAGENYGKFVSLSGAGIFVFGICYFPDRTVDILKGLFGLFFGT